LAGSLVLPSFAAAANRSYNADPQVEDIGPKLRSESAEEVLAENRLDLTGVQRSARALAKSSVSESDVGTTKNWITHNDLTGRYVLTPFTLRAVGTYGEVWVANDLSFPEGDPRNGKVEITDEQVRYLLNEFDNRIYEKEISFFAPPAERHGENAAIPGLYEDEIGRTVILIDNIKDASYEDPNYPSYIAGYFSPAISDLTDRNVMTVDCYDWLNRTGPDAASPYLYEGVFAHEFQHLLHRDTDPNEDNFVNEGLSDFAQYLVGYGHSQGHVDFFMNNLRNSLTMWGDQSDLQILGDYGTGYLFQLYLYERFGEPFIQAEFHNQKQGIEGVEDALAEVGADETFAQVYADYMTAVMLDGQSGIGGKDKNRYKFTSIDLTPNVDASVLPDNVAPAWGTDFKVIEPDSKIEHLYFKGIDFLKTNWTTFQDPEKGAVLWSNEGDLADNFLIKELDLTGRTAPTLSFDTSYRIEEGWDFGAVQVSTDGGETWTSLANDDTRSDVVDEGLPKIKANMPGFTGDSGGWKTETFDLSAYAGQKVLLGFRYMTDWATNEAGWYLSDLKLDGETIDPMTSADGFMSLEQATGQYVDYQVQFIAYKKATGKGKPKPAKLIRFPNLLNMSEHDRIDLRDMLRSSSYDRIVMMTTYAAPAGTNASATYEYTVVKKSKEREDWKNKMNEKMKDKNKRH
jgi:immune inhibitor A